MQLSRKEKLFCRARDAWYRFGHCLFVCRCISCGDIIASDRVFCEECEDGFRAALLSECGVCGKSLCRCLCPDEMLLRGHIHKHIKLYRYLSNDADAVGNRILYRLKRNDIATAFRFLGRELSTRISALLSLDDSYVISYVPRTPDRVLKHGFDQSERLATELKYLLHLPLIRPLARTRKAKTQKALEKKTERRENVENSLFIRKRFHEDLKGKRVLLVDDVVTSGASMCTAAKLLRKCGAKEVVAVSIAVVTRTQNPRAEAEKNSRLPYFMR